MTFKNPEFLFALFALLIPIIIHLFNFRRYKKILFSNIELLKSVTAETRKQNELKHLLVLLFRILTFLFIVIAFAAPQFNSNNLSKVQTGQKSVFIYIDNSFSMGAQYEDGRLIDQAIENARQLVKLLPNDTRFILILNNKSSGNRLLTKESILTELDKIELAPETKLLSAVARNQQKIIVENKLTANEIYMFSDFQKSSTDIANLPEDTTGLYYFIPLSVLKNGNISVDSCWISSPGLIPGKFSQVMIRLKNNSDVDYEKIPLKLTIDNQQKGVAGIDIKAESELIVPVTFIAGKPGWHKGEVSIEDFPVTYDDRLFFSFLVNENIQVLELNDEPSNNFLGKFYSSDSVFKFSNQNYKQFDFNALKNHKLVLLNSLPSFSSGLISQLSTYIQNGGNLFFIPGDEESVKSSNEFLKAMQAGSIAKLDTAQSRVVRINLQDELFRNAIENIPENADLPVVHQHYKYDYSFNSGIEPLVSLINGDGFLFKKNIGKGQLYLLAVPLGNLYSNFTTQSIFVPVMYGATVSGENFTSPYYTIGRDINLVSDVASSPDDDIPVKLTKDESEYSFIPEQQYILGKLWLDVDDNITEDGTYQLSLNDSLLNVFAFNYNRIESNMDFYSISELERSLAESNLKNFKVILPDTNSSSVLINTLQKESNLWKLFVIFALLMILAEIILLKYWK